MVTIPKTEEPAGILAPDGSLQPGARVEEPPELLLEMYRWMVYGRTYDTRLFSLQRQGRLTTYAPVAGQEAIQVGCGLAMRREDWLLISYRDGLAGLVHGVPPEHLALFFRGHPKAGQVPPDVNAFPIQIGIAEQIPHAVGIAWGMKLRGASTAALALFGDGATSEGAFHEAANFAGVFKVPAVLVCQNNGWAISVPRSRQTAAATLAQKAVAYGMPGLQIDGNDIVGVYRTVSAALARARAGEGPTLIETVTYRLGPHTTSDDPTRYRKEDDLATWRDARDPLNRLRVYLERGGLWDQPRQEALEEDARQWVARAVTAALNEPVPPPEAMFDNIYAEPPSSLQAQREEVRALGVQEEGRHA
jgi:pyruvate dehydrogenase E1 component alpha subunit